MTKKFNADVYLPLGCIVIAFSMLLYTCSGETIKRNEKVANTGLVIKHRTVKPFGNRQWSEPSKSYFSVETESGETLLDEREGSGYYWVGEDLVLISQTRYFFCVRDGKITSHEWDAVTKIKLKGRDTIELTNQKGKKVLFNYVTRELKHP